MWDERIKYVCRYLLSNQSEGCLAFFNALVKSTNKNLTVTELIAIEQEQDTFIWKARTNQQEWLTITIQLCSPDFYHERAGYYRAALKQSYCLERAEPYCEGKRISVYLVTFNLLQDSNHYHTHYQLYEKVNHTEPLDVHYIELTKLPNRRPKTDLEDWLCFVRSCAQQLHNQQETQLINNIQNMH